ncbi:MAG: sulfur relay protein DsrC [Hyphomicrobiales bacterium]|nr:sulfur relay protein DsrC [Hyphomicrobiales bacterium]
MANLSDLIISHPDVQSFDELVELVVAAAREGERFIAFDVKPDYRDTPRNWEMKLEAAFYWGDKVQR